MQTRITVGDLINVLLTMPHDQELPVDPDSGFVALDVEVIEPADVAEVPASDVG